MKQQIIVRNLQVCPMINLDVETDLVHGFHELLTTDYTDYHRLIFYFFVHELHEFSRINIYFMTDVIYKDESYKIIRACLDVHNELGSGFLEAIYQEALALEFRN